MSNPRDDEMIRQPLHPNQSGWMAHWMSSNIKSASPAQQQLLHFEPKGDDHKTMSFPLLTRPEVSTDCSKHALDFKEFVEVKTNNDVNDGLVTSSKKSRNEIFKAFPMFDVSKDSMFAVKSEVKSDQTTSHHHIGFRLNNSSDSGFLSSSGGTENKLSSLPVRAPPEIGTSSREYLFQSEGITKCLEQQFLPVKTLGKDSSAASSSSHDDFMRSAAKIVPHGMNRSETSVKSLLSHREEEINQSCSVIASKERIMNSDYKGYLSLFVKEKPIHNGATLLVHDPSPSNSKAPDFLGKRHQNMKNDCALGFFPRRSNSLEETELENLYYQGYSVPRFPCSVRDVETMRLCTAEDSTEELSRGPPIFPQKTHNFSITEKTDVNVSDGSQMFRESLVSTKNKGKMVGEPFSLYPDFSSQVAQGMKLRALDSCTQIECKGMTGGVENSAVQIWNESSAETDTMDMNSLRENHVSGIPDMNQEPPALAGVVSLSYDRETSTSRTQTLNVDPLFPHAEWCTNSKFSDYNNELGPEPSSRWVKRLKSSASGSFGYGTKCMKMGKASPQEKVHNVFGKMSRRGIASPDPQMDKCRGKQPMLIDQTVVPIKNSGSSSNDVLGKGDIILSHPWIQRWCHNQATSPQTKAEAPVICEPLLSKATAFEYRKEFPSIAAMALMGKTMTGFRPCKFINKGTVLVWNTQGF